MSHEFERAVLNEEARQSLERELCAAFLDVQSEVFHLTSVDVESRRLGCDGRVDIAVVASAVARLTNAANELQRAEFAHREAANKCPGVRGVRLTRGAP